LFVCLCGGLFVCLFARLFGVCGDSLGSAAQDTFEFARSVERDEFLEYYADVSVGSPSDAHFKEVPSGRATRSHCVALARASGGGSHAWPHGPLRCMRGGERRLPACSADAVLRQLRTAPQLSEVLFHVDGCFCLVCADRARRVEAGQRQEEIR
jgi:hypothetical protein